MACCSLKCLQCMVFTVALVIMVAVGVGPIVFGILYRNQKVVQALDIQAWFLGSTISVGAIVILFSFCGLCGACKSNKKSARYCLFWYFIFLVLVIVMVVGMLILFIMINKNGEDNLNQFCDKPTPTYYGIWKNLKYLTNYDDQIKAVGTGNRICSSNCGCMLPTGVTTLMYRDTHLTSTATPTSRPTLTSGTNKALSECSTYWDSLSNKYLKAVIQLMGEVENSFNCSGVCIGANISIAKDTSNEKVSQYFTDGQGSCFSKVIDFMKEKWVPGIGLFSGLLAVLLFSIVFVCCICYHDDLKEQ